MHIFELEQQKRRGDLSSRISFKKNNGSLIPFLIIDSFSRKSFSYDPLPPEPINLTVNKLDGTSFEIEVVKKGTVAQLKQAVEAAFSHLPKKGPKRVSWSFIWGQFCLCYDGQKLLTDTDEIGIYGIKDGDKLDFIRHVSISYNMVKDVSEEEDLDLDEPPASEASEDRHLKNKKVDKCNQWDIENQQGVHDIEDMALATNYGHKLANLFRGWFSYHKLPTSDVRLDEHSNAFSFSFSSLGSFKDIIHSGKYNFARETLKAE